MHQSGGELNLNLVRQYIDKYSGRKNFGFLDEEKYNEYKQFFCVDCKPLIEGGEYFGEYGEIDGEPEEL